MLAEDLTSEDVLSIVQDTFGIVIDKIAGQQAICLCVNPKHQDTKPSCSINITTGLFQCFSCHASGDILTLGRYALGKPRKAIRKLLEPDNPDARLALTQRRLKSILRAPQASLGHATASDGGILPDHGLSLTSYKSGPLTYLLDRGFDTATLKRWNIRFVKRAIIPTSKKEAEIANSIAIPVCDRSGRLVFWIYRATDQSFRWQRDGPRYLNTRGAPISSHWFGLHLHSQEKEIVVVEGPLDAMWLDQAGIPAVAIMGSNVTARSKQLETFDKVTLFCDRDGPGVLATLRLGQLLWDRVPTYVARYPKAAKGTDPQSLTLAQARSSVTRAIPWVAWKINKLTSAPLFDKVP